MKIKIIKKRNYQELGILYKTFDVSEDADICIAVGGDGTFIQAAKEFDGPILPIRGNDKGSVGYHADLSVQDIDYVVRSLKSKNYFIETLGNKIELLYKGRKYYAVNEVVLHNLKEEVSFRISEVDGSKRNALYPYTMGGDGILITGIVGSTAYNKSAGGPILLTPEVICLTFLNVDGPFSNPIVIDKEKEVEIEVEKYKGILCYDTIGAGILSQGDKFRVRISDKQIKIVKIKGRVEPFADKLERKVSGRLIK